MVFQYLIICVKKCMKGNERKTNMDIPDLSGRKAKRPKNVGNLNLGKVTKIPAESINLKRIPWKRTGIAALIAMMLGGGYAYRDDITNGVEQAVRQPESPPVTISPAPEPVMPDPEVKHLRQQVQAMRIELSTYRNALHETEEEADLLRQELLETRNRIALELMKQQKIQERVVNLLSKYAEVDFKGHRQVRRIIQLMESRGKK